MLEYARDGYADAEKRNARAEGHREVFRLAARGGQEASGVDGVRETGRLAAPWGRGPRGSSDTQGVSYDVPVAKQSIKLKQCCCPSYRVRFVDFDAYSSCIVASVLCLPEGASYPETNYMKGIVVSEDCGKKLEVAEYSKSR